MNRRLPSFYLERCMYPARQQSISHLHFLDRLSSTDFTEGLIDLSVRCMQPTQQHGRRIPSLSSLTTRFTWSFRVSSFLTKVVQQIHSLRARGVISSHAASAALSEARAFRKSGGILCAVPEEIPCVAIRLLSFDGTSDESFPGGEGGIRTHGPLSRTTS